MTHELMFKFNSSFFNYKKRLSVHLNYTKGNADWFLY